jgi:uncharacterized membrane protein YeaQ/YmgE (transglycosylase-associated protein family)
LNILGWIVVGFIAGGLAAIVVPGHFQLGCLGTIVIGIIGGLIGGALFQWATGEGIGDFGWRSIGVAFVGAAGLLLIVSLVRRPPPRSTPR